MDRTDRAIGYFLDGYNCAQSVVMAYASAYGLDAHYAEAVSGGFGGGTGGLRESCGAWQGIVMIAGLALGYDPRDAKSKTEFYKRIRDMHAKFVARLGSDNCAELLKTAAVAPKEQPAERTPAYYAGRPCARYVATAAQILEEEFFT